MCAFIFQLAASDPFTETVTRVTQGSRLSTRDLLLAILAGTCLAALLFIWAYVHFRRKRQKMEARDFGKLTSTSAGSSEDGEGGRRRRRRRKRAHRPRNPSLQQTGGLPPPRPENEPPKY